ncbi:MAG: hypothetical protein DHS20C15_05790 [Planctomycetota bacterium]|nr:MAG: hypothetical protein DHS20C15_05790 [Planctomycetota bacterium]
MPFMQRVKYFAIVFLAILGAAGAYYGYLELQLSKHALPDAQEISLAELSTDGYGDNAHVLLDDAYLIAWNSIYMEKGGRFASDQWEYAYVPAVSVHSPWYQAFEAGLDDEGIWPDDRELPAFDAINMVVKLPDARDQDDIDAAAQLPTHQGVVINEIESLTLDEKLLLSESFPNADFDTCLIFELGREPSTPNEALAIIIGGAVLLLVGCVLGLRAWRRYQAEQAAEASAS